MRVRDLFKLLPVLLLVATVGISIPLVAGFFGEFHPAFDSFSHFRAHLAALMSVFSLAVIVSGLRKEGAIALLFGVAAFATTLSTSPWAGKVSAAASPDADSAVYKLLQLNLRFDNPEPALVLSLIGRVQPDVIAFEEVSAMWRDRLKVLEAAYPYQIRCDAPKWIGGVVILSRRPFVPPSGETCLGNGSMAYTVVDFGGQAVAITALHLEWPWPFAQARQIDSLAPVLAQLPETALVVGDMNAATWSATVRRIARIGNLGIVPSIGPTWLPRKLPNALRPLIGLPIDHVLSKGVIAVRGVQTLDFVGSDHLPVMVEFSLTSKAPDDDAVSVTAALDR